MITPKPIDQKEIDDIKAEYEKKIAETPALEAVYRIECDSAVATAIGRQRAEALAKGGELAERIKAENEEMLREIEAMKAQISDADMKAAAKLVKEREAAFEENK